jgi:hypothetical protein
MSRTRAAAALPSVIGGPGSDFTLAAYRAAAENNVERTRDPKSQTLQVVLLIGAIGRPGAFSPERPAVAHRPSAGSGSTCGASSARWLAKRISLILFACYGFC